MIEVLHGGDVVIVNFKLYIRVDFSGEQKKQQKPATLQTNESQINDAININTIP